MANFNFTQHDAGSVGRAFCAPAAFQFEVEKISCWNGSLLQVDPFCLLGKRIRVGEHIPGFCDSHELVHESIFYVAKVVAVHVGSAEDGIETSLLLKQDGCDLDYVTVSNLTVLEVFE